MSAAVTSHCATKRAAAVDLTDNDGAAEGQYKRLRGSGGDGHAAVMWTYRESVEQTWSVSTEVRWLPLGSRASEKLEEVPCCCLLTLLDARSLALPKRRRHDRP